MSEPIKALVIDPDARTIEEVDLETHDSQHGAGVLVPLAEFKRVLGCDRVEFTYLKPGVALVVPEGPVEETAPVGFWQYQSESDFEPIPGRSLVHGHDILRDHASDSPITLDEARKDITFRRGIVLKHLLTETERGVAVERVMLREC